MKKQILFFVMAAALVTSGFITSCLSQKWNTDYYSYSQGAYINGAEYHMIGYIVFGENFCGFQIVYHDNFVYFRGFHEDGGLSSTPNGEQKYRLDFLIITDTISFYKGAQFSFCDNGGKLTDYSRSFICVPYGEHYEGPQVVMATVYDLEKKELYKAKEGRIIINSTSESRNDVEFDFIAEDEDGERVVVEKGYIKK